MTSLRGHRTPLLSTHGQEVILDNFSLNWDAYEIASNIYQNYCIQITVEEINESKEKTPVLTYSILQATGVIQLIKNLSA